AAGAADRAGPTRRDPARALRLTPADQRNGGPLTQTTSDRRMPDTSGVTPWYSNAGDAVTEPWTLTVRCQAPGCAGDESATPSNISRSPPSYAVAGDSCTTSASLRVETSPTSPSWCHV